MDIISPQKEELIRFDKKSLRHILQRDGEFIYSSHNTLKKGDIYLLGLNPGGEGFIKIEEHLESILSKETNSYLDESWENRSGKWDKGEAPLQKRVNYLLDTLGYKTREVCSSNIIFVTSRNSNEVNYGLAGYCWRFHEYLLEIIKPKVILCFGVSEISAYAFLRALLDGEELKNYPSGHGNWVCKAFRTTINNRPTIIVGIPHLSYYNIIGKSGVIEWIKGKF